MLQHPDYTRTRIGQATDRFHGRIWSDRAPITELTMAGPVDRIPYAEAVKLDYQPVKLGQPLGPGFATHWFHVQATVPEAWKGERVDLIWSTYSENTIWRDGQPLQGLNGHGNQIRNDAPLLDKARGGDAVELYIEQACNGPFGLRTGSGAADFAVRSPFYLETADLARFDPLAWEIYHDLRVLSELEAEQQTSDLDRSWGGRLLGELNRFLNVIDEDDPSTWSTGLPILKDLLATGTAGYTHELSAIGHAHIDTAWLWPLAETHRKCVRSFSNAVRNMEAYPSFRFSCSQAYQYDYIKREHPGLYEQIVKQVKRGQWVPVGGTWIEPDCNLPSGESLLRQFLYGQRFFEQEFGRRCTEFWNPDVFGYNGQLPQIMRLAGIQRFLTQKLSWNRFNQPLHHTFTWVGVDGSEVLAHFPPADTYNGECHIEELRRHARKYKDNDRSQHAMYLFGFGDGGGGPTRTMLETLERCRDLNGVPRCDQRTSEAFFDLLEADIQDLPRLHGELYFEYHRGTYTTQAATKRGNRKGEILLHDIELLAALAGRLGDAEYPGDALDALWKLLLLNQFHDILPGSSITQVYALTETQLAEIQDRGSVLRDQAMEALGSAVGGSATVPVNTTPFARRDVVAGPSGELVMVDCPPTGFGAAASDAPAAPTVSANPSGFILENEHLRAMIDRAGTVTSLVHKVTGRETFATPGHQLTLYDDRPTKFEAWDIDPFALETGRAVADAETVAIATQHPLRVEVTAARSLGKRSTITQTFRLDAGSPQLEVHCSVDWHESNTLLKANFPTTIRAMHATYEMQWGVVERPNHANNLIALAQFEVPGHRFADLSEHGFGLSLLSESKYGFACREHVLEMSLLRSPKNPDPQADMGSHSFAYALLPHTGDWREGTLPRAAAFNNPLHWTDRGPAEPRSLVTVDGGLVLDTIKRAEDGKGVVLRLYEPYGGRGQTTVRPAILVSKATLCNGLEDLDEAVPVADGAVTVNYTPYQVVSLYLD